MAGDWLKMEVCTPNKPEIFTISAKTKLHPDMIVGKCFRLWSWFDSHTKDGNAAGVTLETIGYALGNGDDTTKFIHAMVDVGWLYADELGVSLPNFDYHNGESAKSRALTAKRVAKSRSKSNDDSVTDVTDAPLAREEKRREEKNKDIKPIGAVAPKAKRLNIDSLPVEWANFCLAERTDLNPGDVWNQFKDYWIAQGGQKGAKLDWFATWRNWVRNQKASIKTKQDKGNEAFHQLTGGMLKPRVIVDDSVFPSITNTIDMEQANARLR